MNGANLSPNGAQSPSPGLRSCPGISRKNNDPPCKGCIPKRPELRAIRGSHLKLISRNNLREKAIANRTLSTTAAFFRSPPRYFLGSPPRAKTALRASVSAFSSACGCQVSFSARTTCSARWMTFSTPLTTKTNHTKNGSLCAEGGRIRVSRHRERIPRHRAR